MTAHIDSASNLRIAAAVKAVATHEKMLLEGRRMIEEALDAGLPIEQILLQRHSDEDKEEDFLRRVRGAAPNAWLATVSMRVLRHLSDLPSTRGVVAIAAPPQRTLTSLSDPLPSKKSPSSNATRRGTVAHANGSEKASSSLFLLLDDVQDPANVGAILRSGEAFGAAAAILTPGCAWPFSPRALRASAGSAFRLPVAARVEAGEALKWARRHGVALAGAAAHGGSAPEDLAGVRPLALVIGSEGHGISADLAASLDHRVTLPLAGRVDSLNAAVAAGVLLHILSRPPALSRTQAIGVDSVPAR